MFDFEYAQYNRLSSKYMDERLITEGSAGPVEKLSILSSENNDSN